MAKSEIFSTFSFIFFLLVKTSVSDSHETFVSCLEAQTTTFPTSNSVLTQPDVLYNSTLRAYIRNARFNTSSTPKPEIIVTPSDETHVQAAIICSKKLGFTLKIRSGGHDYDGLSYISQTRFSVLDMSAFRNVLVDISDESAWIETGAILGEVYYRIFEKSKIYGFPGGVCPTVGVGGHFSGGGYGNLLRKFGLSVDHIVDAKIVDVNGKILDRKSMGEDLFWAIRGGGGASFGVVIGYKIKLVKVPETVTVFRVEKLLEQKAIDMVHKWQFFAPKADPNLFMRLLLQPVTRNKKQTLRASVLCLFLGKTEELLSLTKREFPELGLRIENCTQMNWIQSVLWWGNFVNVTEISPAALLNRNLDSSSFLKRKSDFVSTEINKQNLTTIFDKMIKTGKVGMVFNPYGGRMREIPVTETPFPHRNELYKIQYSVNWNEPGAEAEKKFLNEARTLFEFMTPFVSKKPRGAYFNYRDIDIGINRRGVDSFKEGEVYGRKYFGQNFDRLVKVKTQADPDGFFWNEQSIPTFSR